MSSNSSEESIDINFLLDFQFSISIQLDYPVLIGQIADPRANITKISLDNLTRYNQRDDLVYELSDEERSDLAYPFSTISLIDYNTEYFQTFQAKNNSYFTINEILEALLIFETNNRPKMRWFGGIDIYHTVFDKLVPDQHREHTYMIKYSSS